MDVHEVLALKDRGGLLMVAQPTGAKDGPAALASEIHCWIDQAGKLNGNKKLKPFLPAVTFLKEELSKRLEALSELSREE